MTTAPPSAERPSRLTVWLLAARPKTLWAAVAPVMVGTAMAYEAGGFHAAAALVALLCAVLIQIGTNLANDYSDFEKGADTDERVGPLRVTQAGLAAPESVRRAAGVFFALAFAAGMYLVWRGGWPILVIGVLSILSGILYTAGKRSLGYMGLGDLFVMVFFGPVAVGGTFYVQTLALDSLAVIAGLGPGLLAVAILLANNIRDVDQDRIAGKRTLVVRFGRAFGASLYATCLVGAGLVVVALVWATESHALALLACVVSPLGFPVYRKLASEPVARRLNPALGSTARLLLLYSVLFSIGWIAGS